MVEAPGGDLEVAIQEIAAAKDLADRYGLSLVAYEGGQHLVGAAFGEFDSAESTALFMAANESDRLYDIYSRYLQAWRDAGGGLFNHFVSCINYGQFGSWGAIRYQEETADQRPKYRALLDALNGDLTESTSAD